MEKRRNQILETCQNQNKLNWNTGDPDIQGLLIQSEDTEFILPILSHSKACTHSPILGCLLLMNVSSLFQGSENYTSTFATWKECFQFSTFFSEERHGQLHSQGVKKGRFLARKPSLGDCPFQPSFKRVLRVTTVNQREEIPVVTSKLPLNHRGYFITYLSTSALNC